MIKKEETRNKTKLDDLPIRTKTTRKSKYTNTIKHISYWKLNTTNIK